MPTRKVDERERVYREFAKASKALRNVADWVDGRAFDPEIARRLYAVREASLMGTNGETVKVNTYRLLWALQERLTDLPRVCMGEGEGVWSAIDPDE